ncbi:recombinase family protein (plasmid) [Xylophilus rhododendri]|uniref:Recombinase family protein n=1 Tax=Xylophilus rhododendri TaxID=2697032 RepID=A0A857JEX1_9BURK|nr:recombinase family protein [Xylophilus rhododendri]QHJ01742.1 recombinase family protein [Xylophilus rhododendri]
MPKVIAYLRVSTDAQDVANQRHGIAGYCVARALHAPMFIEDTVSGRTPWQQRQLGVLIDQAEAGDVLVVAEISRLARSTLQVLEIMRKCVGKHVHLHIVKSGIVLDGSMQSTIMGTMLGLAAEIERDFISSRTKEALARRKAAGIQLGRPPGRAAHLTLDPQASVIDGYLSKKMPKRTMAKLLGVAPNTLYGWLRARRPAKAPRPKKG